MRRLRAGRQPRIRGTGGLKVGYRLLGYRLKEHIEQAGRAHFIPGGGCEEGGGGEEQGGQGRRLRLEVRRVRKVRRVRRVITLIMNTLITKSC